MFSGDNYLHFGPRWKVTVERDEQFTEMPLCFLSSNHKRLFYSESNKNLKIKKIIINKKKKEEKRSQTYNGLAAGSGRGGMPGHRESQGQTKNVLHCT